MTDPTLDPRDAALKLARKALEDIANSSITNRDISPIAWAREVKGIAASAFAAIDEQSQRPAAVVQEPPLSVEAELRIVKAELEVVRALNAQKIEHDRSLHRDARRWRDFKAVLNEAKE